MSESEKARPRRKLVVIGNGMAAGRVLEELFERALRRGIEVFTEANTQAILGGSRVEGLKLDDGRVIPADMVAMAVGIRPNARLAKEAGLIHIAGAAGLHVRATDLLGHVDTEEDALEYVAAVLQLYREEAAYLDRVYKWVEKTGLERIRSTIMDDAPARKALLERFLVSQRAVRKDPWAERAAGFGSQEFTPLAIVMPIAAE